MNFTLSLKHRVWIVTLVFAGVASHFLRAQNREHPVKLFSFTVSSSSDLLDGTRGSVRAIYADAAHKNLIGIDYCHNHWGMYPEVNSTSHGCAKTIPISDLKNGAKVISIPKIGTALEVKAPNFSPTNGGTVDIVIGHKLRAIGSNSYRKIQLDLIPNTKDVLIANYKGGFVGEVKLKGWATAVLLKGGLDSIELTTGPEYGNRSIYKTEVSSLEKP